MRYRTEDEKQTANQLILFMAHVEQICEQHGLQPPVEVDLADAKGLRWRFEYDPEFEEIDIPFVQLQTPITLRIQDQHGLVVEKEFTTLTADRQWLKNFLQ